MTAVGYLGDVLAADLAAETAARVSGDSTLSGLITAEAASRAAGDTSAIATATAAGTSAAAGLAIVLGGI